MLNTDDPGSSFLEYLHGNEIHWGVFKYCNEGFLGVSECVDIIDDAFEGHAEPGETHRSKRFHGPWKLQITLFRIDKAKKLTMLTPWSC